MKLHKIRVENLNSLYGDQSVDFDRDLAGASLFLIQGPTGAGKSTLMDAVSLALFGTTPRMEGARSEREVAESVMSRGTGTTLAELEFSKLDATGGRVRYRACWRARRAREKATGNMQGTERSLERRGADGRWELLVSSQKRKDYRPHFDALLEGFSPADFQRSMLLAQGQFDAMLHAPDEERAAILERLTDTASYQRLGERAARMRGRWMRRLETRRVERDAIAPLSGEALAEAKGELERAQRELEAQEARRDVLREVMTWRDRKVDLVAQATAAKERLAAAEAKAAEAGPRLETLARHEAAREAFQAADRVASVRAELGALQEALRGLDAERPQREAEVASHREAHARAVTDRDRWGAALDALRAPATAATAAATTLAQARAEAEQAHAHRRLAGQRQADAQATRKQRAEALQAAEQKKAQAGASLAARAAGEAIDAGLAALEARWATLRQGREQHEQARERLEAARGQHRADTAALATDRERHREREARELGPLQARLEQARGALRALTGEASVADARARHQAALEIAEAQREPLQQALTAVDQRDRCRTAAQRRAEAVATAAKALDEASSAAEAKARDLAHAQELQGQAEEHEAGLRRIAALSEARGELQPGEPCPLCGSEEHPFVSDPAQRAQAEVVEEQVQRASARLQSARAATKQAVEAHGRASIDASAAAARHETAATEAAQAEREREQAEAQVASALQALAWEGPAARADLDRALAAVGEQVQVARDRLQRLTAADDAERQAAEALERTRQELEGQARGLDDRQVTLEAQQQARDAEAERLGADAQALEQQADGLRGELAGLGVVADAVAEGVASARAQAQAWREARDRVQAAEAACAEARARLETADAQLAEHARAVHEADEACTRRNGALAEAQAASEAAQAAWERVWAAACALDGPEALPRPGLDRPPAERVAFQEDRAQHLREQADALGQAVQAAERALTEAQALRDAKADEARRAGERLEVARGALLEHRQRLSIASDEALEARRLSPETVQSLTSEREALRKASTEAQAAVETFAAQLQQHEAGRPEADADLGDREALDLAMASVTTTIATAREAWKQAHTTVEMATRDEARLAEAQAALAADEEAARVWLELHELIGKGDGKAFRLFAQALNLDQLLRRANVHLATLNDRYHLVPIRDDDGLPTLGFEVEDRWRPGTTRSLKTLSGGESFLVSLALALGLSDLRTSSMPVETLLLDEGFGTLDPATLDTALAALQQLQASGRQVGLISHVVGLAERIEARVRVEPIGEGRSRVRVG